MLNSRLTTTNLNRTHPDTRLDLPLPRSQQNGLLWEPLETECTIKRSKLPEFDATHGTKIQSLPTFHLMKRHPLDPLKSLLIKDTENTSVLPQFPGAGLLWRPLPILPPILMLVTAVAAWIEKILRRKMTALFRRPMVLFLTLIRMTSQRHHHRKPLCRRLCLNRSTKKRQHLTHPPRPLMQSQDSSKDSSLLPRHILDPTQRRQIPETVATVVSGTVFCPINIPTT